MKRLLMVLACLMLFVAPQVLAGGKAFIKPKPKDKCPVCGMFVAKYPDFLAEIIFKDGSYAVFDGNKDMFKYYFNLDRYNPTKKQIDIDTIHVMNYYDLAPIDGFTAWYVVGSNVYGPMGRELISFAKEEDAKEFMADHVGKALYRFQDITREIVEGLD